MVDNSHMESETVLFALYETKNIRRGLPERELETALQMGGFIITETYGGQSEGFRDYTIIVQGAKEDELYQLLDKLTYAGVWDIEGERPAGTTEEDLRP